ncbi:hypothetical protein E2C01_077005 [Portunus trituberculatus]|uniref:Uncharacterized protein n=1 Tax=Portunus trituberculatus TaxID=210409 RepID=A0A5B7IKL0_PORTR|nr:hypothetical protein [Portunus trituberculatus]
MYEGSSPQTLNTSRGEYSTAQTAQVMLLPLCCEVLCQVPFRQLVEGLPLRVDHFSFVLLTDVIAIRKLSAWRRRIDWLGVRVEGRGAKVRN